MIYPISELIERILGDLSENLSANAGDILQPFVINDLPVLENAGEQIEKLERNDHA